MDELQPLTCANCGAALDPALRGALITCRYCNVSFRVPLTLTPEPDLGELILGADFRDPQIPGWRLVEPEHRRVEAGPPPQLVALQPSSEMIHGVLRTPGPFDDFDVGVTLCIISGNYDYISAGFELRSNNAGDYNVRVSAQGTFQIGFHEGTAWGGALMDWSTHPALHQGFGKANRVRVQVRGNQIRVYLNGVLAASLRDERFDEGTVRLIISPSQHGQAEVAYRDLQLREIKRG